MATFLYRLGRLAARRAWLTLAAWVAVLAALGGLVAGFATPPTSQITIPGAGFQEVLAGLGREIPSAAGGIGTITIENERGRITPEQRAAVERTITAWERAPQVQSVMDPFASQQRLDDARDRDVATQRGELDDGGLDRDDPLLGRAGSARARRAAAGLLVRARQDERARGHPDPSDHPSTSSRDAPRTASRLATATPSA